MGLVVVLVDALFAGYDGVPDPLGWLLVIAGLVALRPALDVRTLLGAAGLCLVVSVATYPPQLSDRLDDAGGFLLSLPQLVFGFLLCTAVAPAAGPLAGRFRVLRRLLVGLAVAPVVVLGGGVEALRDPLAFASVAVQVYLVYLLFASAGRIPGPAHDGSGDATRAAPDGSGPR